MHDNCILRDTTADFAPQVPNFCTNIQCQSRSGDLALPVLPIPRLARLSLLEARQNAGNIDWGVILDVRERGKIETGFSCSRGTACCH